MLIRDENHGKLFLRINLISVLGPLLKHLAWCLVVVVVPIIVRALYC